MYWSGANKERADEKNKLLRHKEGSVKKDNRSSKENGWAFQPRGKSVKQESLDERTIAHQRAMDVQSFHARRKSPGSKIHENVNLRGQWNAVAPSSSL